MKMWIKKFLSLFIEKAVEGCETTIGFGYLLQSGWDGYEDWEERTISLCLPLPWKTEKPYIDYCGDAVCYGERWLTISVGFRYIKIGRKRSFKPMFYSFWTPIGNTKIIDTTYNMYLKGAKVD